MNLAKLVLEVPKNGFTVLHRKNLWPNDVGLSNDPGHQRLLSTQSFLEFSTLRAAGWF